MGKGMKTPGLCALMYQTDEIKCQGNTNTSTQRDGRRDSVGIYLPGGDSAGGGVKIHRVDKTKEVLIKR